MIKPSLNPTATALIALIKASITADPREHDGHLWCGKSHRERAEALGLSEKTIRRLIKDPPFVFDTISNLTLVRIGKPGEKPSSRITAKRMAKVYRAYLAKHIPPRRKELEDRKAKLEAMHPKPEEEIKAVYKSLSNLPERETVRDFGCLVGLAKDWPDGAQAEVLEIVFGNWTEFMAGVKHVQAMQREANRKIMEADPAAKVAEVRPLFFDYPHIPTIRKYWKVALEVAEAHYQAAGKHPPNGFKALNPGLWKHLK